MFPDQATLQYNGAAATIDQPCNPKDPYSVIREKVLMIPKLQKKVKDQANEILQLRQQLQLKNEEGVKTNEELDAKHQEVLTLKDEIINLKRILDKTEKQKRAVAVYLKKTAESKTVLRQEVAAASGLKYVNIKLTEEVKTLSGIVRKLRAELVETKSQKRKVEEELDGVKAEISDLAFGGSGPVPDTSEADESDEFNYDDAEPVMPVLVPMNVVEGNQGQGKKEERGVGAEGKRPRVEFCLGTKRNEKKFDSDQSLGFAVADDDSERSVKVLLSRCGISSNYFAKKLPM
ncbi:unnamed protein product [Orchesella dallaii]|uniref:Uncharacterized protein n=1 Tax=Orchesella dallaii TaxID=48710 RepID=A0ABP1Q1E7_9HEXA